MSVAEPEEIHIRRRVHGAQRAIKVEGLHARYEIQPLRQHDWKDVAGRNVFLSVSHAAKKFLPIGSRLHFQFAACAICAELPEARLKSRGELLLECCNVVNGPLVRSLRTF